ncbi:OmpA family protein [Poseidonocella pacifica]|nr:OmpA family protein [Poseidonocella pacifica]
MKFATKIAVMAVWASAALGMAAPAISATGEGLRVTGRIDWSLWIDADGCQHWWADGGVEGYMVPRRNPRSGRPICSKPTRCLVSGTLFQGDATTLSETGRAELGRFFEGRKDSAISIYDSSASQGSAERRRRISQARAEAVSALARASGKVVAYEGAAATASGGTEIQCYGW